MSRSERAAAPIGSAWRPESEAQALPFVLRSRRRPPSLGAPTRTAAENKEQSLTRRSGVGLRGGARRSPEAGRRG